ncbi:MAG: hypothetical protein Q9186_006353 [Xanthomendoza sp. 1 TL-2023]
MTSGNEAVNSLESLVQTQGKTLTTVQEVQKKWTLALEQRTDDLHALDTKHRTALKAVKNTESKLADLLQQETKTRQEVEGIRIQLNDASARVEQARTEESTLQESIQKRKAEQSADWQRLEDKAAELQTTENQQKMRSDELESRYKLQKVRVTELQVREATAHHVASENERNQSDLHQALASLRSFTILADRDGNSAQHLLLEARDIVMIIETEMSNLKAQIDQDVARAYSSSQDVNHWMGVSSERASRINSLEDKITCHNQIMRDQQDTIGQHLHQIRNLETEKEALQNASKDVEREQQELTSRHTQELDRLQQKTKDVEERLREMSDESATRQRRINQLETKQIDVRNSFSAAKDDLTRELDQSKLREKDLKAQIEDAEKDRTVKDQKISELEHDKDCLELGLDQAEMTAEATTKAEKQKYSDLENARNDLQQRFDQAELNAKATTEIEQQKSSDLEKSRTDLQRRLDQAELTAKVTSEAEQQKFSDLEKSRNELQQRLDQAELTAEATVKAEQQKVSDLEHVRVGLQSQLSKGEEKVKAEQRKLSDLMHVSDELKSRLIQAEENAKTTQQVSSVLQDGLRKSLTELQGSLAGKENRISQLETMEKEHKISHSTWANTQRILEEERDELQRKAAKHSKLYEEIVIQRDEYQQRNLKLKADYDQQQDNNQRFATKLDNILAGRYKDYKPAENWEHYLEYIEDISKSLVSREETIRRLSVLLFPKKSKAISWDVAQAEVIEQVKQLQKDRDSVVATSMASKQEQQRLQTEIGAVLSRLDNENKKTTELNEKLQALEVERNTLVNAKSETQAVRLQMRLVTTERNDLKRRGADSKAQLDATKTDLVYWKERWDNDQFNRAIERRDVEKLKLKLAGLSTQNQDLQKEVTPLRDRVTAADQELANLKVQNAALREEGRTLHRRTHEQRQDSRTHLPSLVGSSSRQSGQPEADLASVERDSSNDGPPSRKRARTTKAKANQSATLNPAKAASSDQRPRSLGAVADTPPDVNPDSESWTLIDDFRNDDFAYGGPPQALFDRVRECMSDWDKRRNSDGPHGSWMSGTKSGVPACAAEFARRNKSELPLGYACDVCKERKIPCVAVKAGKVQLCPLHPIYRGESSKADMGYWVRS